MDADEDVASAIGMPALCNLSTNDSAPVGTVRSTFSERVQQIDSIIAMAYLATLERRTKAPSYWHAIQPLTAPPTVDAANISGHRYQIKNVFMISSQHLLPLEVL